MIILDDGVVTLFSYRIVVPCSLGRYLNNAECVKCEYGTYQDNTGQTYCKKCPDHTTTPGRESRASTECSVKLDNTDINGNMHCSTENNFSHNFLKSRWKVWPCMLFFPFNICINVFLQITSSYSVVSSVDQFSSLLSLA